jgi:TolA-binding protein
MRLFGNLLPAALSALLLLSSTHLPAQKATLGNLAGSLRITGGKLPSQRILVELKLHGSAIQSTFADHEGRFVFRQLTYNAYTVSVTTAEYVPADKVVVVRPDVTQTTFVSMILHPKEPSDPEQPPEVAAGGNPHAVDLGDYLANIDSAIRHYQKALELAPGFFQAYNNLGAEYLKKEDFPAAEEAFRKAVNLNQADANAFFNLGNVCLLTQRYEDAEGALREGLRRESRSAFGLYLLGAVLARKGEFIEAELSLRKAWGVAPEMSNVLLELAQLFLMQQRTEDAVNELQKFVELFPSDPMIPRVRDILENLEAPS